MSPLPGVASHALPKDEGVGKSQFNNILFSPLGDKENPAAIERLVELARRNEASVTLFGIVDEPSRIQRAIRGAEHTRAVLAAEEDLLLVKLAKCAANTGDFGAETVVRYGRPGLAIIEQVLQGGHDLVVVTTDEGSQYRAAIKRLLRMCPCPVWVIRPTRARTQRVLAAIHPDPDELELNRSILEIAANLVSSSGGELHVVAAWQLFGESALRSSAFVQIPESELEQLLTNEEARQRRAVGELLTASDIEAAPWQIHVQKGDPARVVTEVIAKKQINLLVIGTVGRTGVPGLVIGNTAETVLDEVRCSVVATKPPGFISPVELSFH